MIHPSPSAVRVFGKSMHMFAAGWGVSVAWFWVAQVQQHVLRHGVWPPNYAMSTVAEGLLPSAFIVLIGLAVDIWAGRAPSTSLGRREWWHAFWWAFMPNALLLITVWVMIQEGQ
jgi:hypothetical protein